MISVADPAWMTRVKEIVAHVDELAAEMNRPQVAASSALMTKLSREHGELEKIARPYREYRRVTDQLAESQELAADGSDPELR